MHRTFPVLLAALLIGSLAHADTLAQAATKTWQISLQGSEEDTGEDCTLNLVANGPAGRYEISAKDKGYRCSFYGPVKITAGEEPEGALVFVEGARGGDGDHTGPVLDVYRLTTKGFRSLGRQELFDAQYHSRDGRIVSVSGKVLFSFCAVCDGPEAAAEEDNIFVPATLRVGCGGLCVRPEASAKQRAAIVARFERRKAELAQDKSYADDGGADTKKLERKLRAFLSKGQ